MRSAGRTSTVAPDRHLLDGHQFLDAIPDDAGLAWCEIAKRLDRVSARPMRVVLERVGEREEEEQERAFDPLPQHGRAGRRQQHQQVDVEANVAAHQAAGADAQDVEGAKAVRGQVAGDDHGVGRRDGALEHQVTESATPHARLRAS